jgi:hypothetical protein
MFYRTGDFNMTICAKFVGREVSSCTRGNACICHDFIEGCDCENCKASELDIVKNEMEHVGWWFQNGQAALQFSMSYPYPIGHQIPEGIKIGKIYRYR